MSFFGSTGTSAWQTAVQSIYGQSQIGGLPGGSTGAGDYRAPEVAVRAAGLAPIAGRFVFNFHQASRAPFGFEGGTLAGELAEKFPARLFTARRRARRWRF